MTHDEASELLAAYSLDAVDGAEGTELEEHLASCPRCRSELDGLREVAAAMGNSVEPLPDGLWSHIASRLPERGSEEEEPPPMPTLASGERTPSPFRAPTEARRRQRRVGVTTVGAIAVAAAAVAVVLGIGLVRADNRASDLQAQVAQQPATVAHALATPGRRLVDLESTSHTQVAQFVVVPDGRGYLVTSSLPTLAKGRTYQLWGIAGSQAISLGLLGSAPHQAVFTMAGTNRPSRLSITAEPAGGTVMPTTAVVATGTV
jgi:anti-sigma factor RsiW